MLVKFEIYHDGEFWCARGIGVDIFTQGKTLDELTMNLQDAVRLHFEECIDSGELITIVSLTEFQVGSVAKISGCERSGSSKRCLSLTGYSTLCQLSRIFAIIIPCITNCPHRFFILLFSHKHRTGSFPQALPCAIASGLYTASGTGEMSSRHHGWPGARMKVTFPDPDVFPCFLIRLPGDSTLPQTHIPKRQGPGFRIQSHSFLMKCMYLLHPDLHGQGRVDHHSKEIYLHNCQRISGVRMVKAIEVVYEDNVFKPVEPIEGVKEHERMVAIISRRTNKKGLRNLAGIITMAEARELQHLIDREFETIVGDW